MDNNKVVLYFSGGTMSGVFGAGVVTTLEKSNIYSNIEAVYGTSAGAMNSAYFLSNQTELGSTIYWEDLNKGFISIKDFWIGVWQRFQNRFIKKIDNNLLHDAINTDYLMKVITQEKILDVNKVIKSSIPFYIKLLNLDTHTIEFIDARQPDILDILKVSVHVFPYVHGVIKIDGKRYIDSAIPDIIGIKALVARHPDRKIVIVLNSPKKRKVIYKLKNILEGKFMEWMFKDDLLYPLFANTENRLIEDLKYIETNPNVILVYPPNNFNIRSRTTDSKKLKNAWKIGVVEGRRIINSINNLNNDIMI